MIYAWVSVLNSGTLVNIWSMLRSPTLGMLSAFENSKVYCKLSTRCPMTSRSTPCPPHCCEWTLRADLSELHQPSPLVFGFRLGSASGRQQQETGGWKGKTRMPTLLLTNNPNESFWTTGWRWLCSSTERSSCCW